MNERQWLWRRLRRRYVHIMMLHACKMKQNNKYELNPTGSSQTIQLWNVKISFHRTSSFVCVKQLLYTQFPETARLPVIYSLYTMIPPSMNQIRPVVHEKINSLKKIEKKIFFKKIFFVYFVLRVKKNIFWKFQLNPTSSCWETCLWTRTFMESQQCVRSSMRDGKSSQKKQQQQQQKKTLERCNSCRHFMSS